MRNQVPDRKSLKPLKYEDVVAAFGGDKKRMEAFAAGAQKYGGFPPGPSASAKPDGKPEAGHNT